MNPIQQKIPIFDYTPGHFGERVPVPDPNIPIKIVPTHDPNEPLHGGVKVLQFGQKTIYMH